MPEQRLPPPEAALRRDLRTLAPLAGEDWFARELYHSLASRRWRHEQTGGVVAPSWREAERLVNEARAGEGVPSLELAQRGGEGELSDTVDRALRERGWTSEPLDAGHYDDAHADASELQHFTPAGTEWERRAHEEARRERLRGG
jgi:hypothetical protein